MNRTKSGIYSGTDSTNVKLMFKEVCLFLIQIRYIYYNHIFRNLCLSQIESSQKSNKLLSNPMKYYIYKYITYHIPYIVNIIIKIEIGCL